MKICILTHTLPRFKTDTNSASFISELAESLSKQGHSVVVLAPFDPLFKKYKRAFKLVTYKYIWPQSLHVSGYSRVLGGDKKMKPYMYIVSTLMSLSALFHLIYLSKKHKFDVISAHWAIPNGAIAFFASFLTNIPYTITIPGSDVYLASKNFFFKLFALFSTSRAKWVISDSQHYLNQLEKLSIHPSNQSVIRYGVDTKTLRPMNKNEKILSQFGVPKNNKVILGLGRFVEKKGFVYLIEAMKNVVKYFPHTSLVLIGDGDQRGHFEKLIKKLKLGKHVFLPGAVPYSQRAMYYNVSDIFVMPSVRDSEGNIDASPVAMMDAMACGVPVVATKYSGSPDLVINGKSGWMVKENSAKEIGSAISNLLKSKNKKMLRGNARKIAIAHFSLEQTAKKYSDIFKQIAK